ncbi:hypothetical protein Tco_1220862 [Tanacetum coccineum]
MTRSSTNDLFTPFKDPEREFRSSRKHFKTLSLDELRSLDFNLFSDQVYSKEEVAETMAETIEQYISKNRADYGSGELSTKTFSGSDHEDANEHIEKFLEIVDLFHIPSITIDQVMLRAFPKSLTGAASRWLRNKPTGSIKTWDGLKTKFLNKYCLPTRTAKKMEEINNFQQDPEENLYQAREQFKELLMKCPQHYLTEMQETAADAKVAIKKMAEYSQKWHNGTSRSRSTETLDGLAAIQAQLNNLGREIKKVNEKVYAAQVGCEQCKGPHYTKDCPLKEEGKTLEEAYYTQSMEDTLNKFMSELAKRHEENSNLIKEIRASTDAAIQNQRATIKTLEIQIGQMSKVLQERGFRSLPSSTKANPRDQVKSISTTIEVDSYPIRRIGSSQYAVSTGHNRTLMYETRQMMIPFPSHLNGYYCEEKKGSYRPQFSKAYSEASHINNSIPRKEKDPRRLGELAHTKLTVELADRIVKYLKGIVENVLVGIGKFVFPAEFIILDMPEDIKVPLILRRPFLSTARVKIDVYK